MLVNNETGVIQPIQKKDDFNKNIGWFHCDAVQAFGKIPIDFINMPFDSISLSSHKIHGPKGIGALVVKDPSKLPGFIFGGMQENSMRAGTESIANIVGFASAAKKIDTMLQSQKNHVSELRNYVEKRLIKLGATILGKNADRVYNTCCFGFKNISGDSLLAELDTHGICLSSGSACSNLESSDNYVLKKMGIKEIDSKSVVRLSLSINNTFEECIYFLNKCEEVVTNFRQLITI
jgi:cysteine desulfurase